MTESEIWWVAGLLEGEGSFIRSPDRRNGSHRGRISMSSTDHDVLIKLQKITGAGRIYEVRRDPREGRKALWHWMLNSQADVFMLATKLQPLLGNRRREQVDLLLDLYDSDDAPFW